MARKDEFFFFYSSKEIEDMTSTSTRVAVQVAIEVSGSRPSANWILRHLRVQSPFCKGLETQIG